jgi:ABC-type multidrug transport system fused ATPase/permease subunit
MKFLYVLWKDILNFFKRDTFCILVLLLGMVASNVMFIYYMGNIIHAGRALRTTTLTVMRTEAIQKLDKDALLKLENNYNVDSWHYTIAGKEALDGNDNRTSYLNRDEYFDALREYATGMGSEETITIFGARRLTDYYAFQGKINYLKRDNTILIPEKLSVNGQAFERITLCGHEFEVVGTIAGFDFLMSEETYLASGLCPDIMVFELPTTNRNTIASFEQSLGHILGDTYEMRQAETQDGNGEVEKAMIVASIIFVMAVLALLYLCAYIFESYALEAAVYSIVGVTKCKIAWLLNTILLSFLLLAGLLAVGIHAALYESVFSSLNWLPFSYSIGEYIAYVMLGVVLIFIVEACYIRSRIKDAPILMKRRFDE